MDKLPCVTAKSIEILQKTLKTQKNNPLHQTSLNSPNPEKKKHTQKEGNARYTKRCNVQFLRTCVYSAWDGQPKMYFTRCKSVFVFVCLCAAWQKQQQQQKNTKHEHTCLNLCFPRVWFFNLCKHGDGSLHHAVSHCCALRPLSVLCVMDDREGK